MALFTFTDRDYVNILSYSRVDIAKIGGVCTASLVYASMDIEQVK